MAGSVVYATTPQPEPDDVLAAALVRFLATKSVPLYLRGPAETWLTARATER